MTTLIETPAPAPTTGAGAAPLRAAGIDVSLTGTAIATRSGTTRIPTKGKRADSITARRDRLIHITRGTLTAVGDVDLAVIEGPSHHSIGGSVWDRGGLWWLIVDGLIDRDIAVAVCPPQCRAKYATGSGAARKAAVMASVRDRYGVACETDDEADALVLLAMGLDRLEQPLTAAPESHRVALAGVQWPDLGAGSA